MRRRPPPPHAARLAPHCPSYRQIHLTSLAGHRAPSVHYYSTGRRRLLLISPPADAASHWPVAARHSSLAPHHSAPAPLSGPSLRLSLLTISHRRLTHARPLPGHRQHRHHLSIRHSLAAAAAAPAPGCSSIAGTGYSTAAVPFHRRSSSICCCPSTGYQISTDHHCRFSTITSLLLPSSPSQLPGVHHQLTFSPASPPARRYHSTARHSPVAAPFYQHLSQLTSTTLFIAIFHSLYFLFAAFRMLPARAHLAAVRPGVCAGAARSSPLLALRRRRPPFLHSLFSLSAQLSSSSSGNSTRSTHHCRRAGTGIWHSSLSLSGKSSQQVSQGRRRAGHWHSSRRTGRCGHSLSPSRCAAIIVHSCIKASYCIAAAIDHCLPPNAASSLCRLSPPPASSLSLWPILARQFPAPPPPPFFRLSLLTLHHHLALSFTFTLASAFSAVYQLPAGTQPFALAAH